MENERILKAVLQFGLDKQSLEQVRQGTKSIEEGLKEVQKQTEASMKKFESWKQKAEKLQSVGLAIGTAGAGLVAPLAAAMASYVKAAGTSERSSARWLAANDKIAASTQRIGKVAVDAVAPVFEQVAGLAEKAAAFAEKNPDAVKAILGIATAMVGVGGLMTLASQGIKLVADVKYIAAAVTNLTAAKIMDGAANKNLAAGANQGGLLGGLLNILGKVFAVVGGVLAGNAVYNASPLKKSQGGLSAEQIWTGAGGVIAAGWAGIAGGRKAMDDSLAETEKKMRAMGQATEDAGEQLGLTQEKMRNLAARYVEYQKEEAAAAQQLEQDKQKASADYQRQTLAQETQFRKDQAAAEKSYLEDRQQAEASYRAESSLALRDYANETRQTEEDYYLERANAARDFNEQAQRAEEDFQRDQARKREDFNQQVEDLVGAGDARGYERALRAYELDRQRSQEDFGIDSGRNSADFGRQQADREAQFALERERKAQEFAQQQADRAVQFAQERADKAAEFAEQQRDREGQFKEEQLKARSDFGERMRDLERQFADERQKRYDALRTAFMDELGLRAQFNTAVMGMVQSMVDAIQAANPNGSAPQGSRASGGYVNEGLWKLHGGEFVMNARTTRAAEAAAGRKLDERTMLGMLAGGRGVTWNDQRRFDSRLSTQDRRQVMNDTLGVLTEALRG